MFPFTYSRAPGLKSGVKSCSKLALTLCLTKRNKDFEILSTIKKEPFVLSSLMHGGAIVASYTYDDTPREGMFKKPNFLIVWISIS